MGEANAALDLADAAAGGDPDGRAAGLGQDHDLRQARAHAARRRRRSVAARVLRRLPSRGHRAAEDGRGAGRARISFASAIERAAGWRLRARALEYARTHYYDVLIVDTAGRLAIDEQMMREIAELHAALKPVETLFVVDAMQGQDAVNVARAFDERAAAHRRDPDQARRRRARRRGAVGAPRHRQADQVRRRRARSSTGAGAVPSRAHGVAHPRHGRHPVARRGGARARSTSRKPSASPRRSRRARASTSRTSSSRSQQMKKMGGVAALARQAAGAARRPDRPGAAAGRQAVPPHRGHHQLDDAAGARAARAASRPRASGASPPAPACRCRR